MALGGLSGWPATVHAGRSGEHASLHPRADCRSAGEGVAMAIEKTDVVIVGVGAAGGILAAELGKAGMKVIGLERGPRLATEDSRRTMSCAVCSGRCCMSRRMSCRLPGGPMRMCAPRH